ncbi:biogenesis of lysosome-related organelles complex 1 subunit 3 isoform X3 [Solea solea]|uniref:biogenesis of lysosome-related organelles complex 1 subunit 3 isoform X3 n=1 Tax=Solea solea TaxID=90069 RepID=UPI00272A3804|nr:biogenesis of lysosome-related organelles complex 1 subunit 3 isoform X3 [Solea solea]
MASRYQIVVQGEASETDSDDEVYITSSPAPHTASGGAKVPGEASETDSEEDSGEERADRVSVMSHESAQIFKRDLPPLIVVKDHPDIQSIVEDRPSPTHRPHGDTLLQQKLQESNSRLYHDVSQTLRQVYSGATREILPVIPPLYHHHHHHHHHHHPHPGAVTDWMQADRTSWCNVQSCRSAGITD